MTSESLDSSWKHLAPPPTSERVSPSSKDDLGTTDTVVEFVAAEAVVAADVVGMAVERAGVIV